MKSIAGASREALLRTILLYAAAALLAKVFVSILLEYRWYFPPDFDSSAFLIGRREFFNGIYAAAFYAHIIAGPLAILLGSFLILTGGRASLGRRHSWAGRLQGLIVIAVIMPSGLVMASRARAGAVAGGGFALLALATAASAIIAIQLARRGQLQSHRKWAMRCFILLCSPLLLRIAVGGSIALGIESELFYSLTAWLSWLIPLAVYEVARRIPAGSVAAVSLSHNLPTTN